MKQAKDEPGRPLLVSTLALAANAVIFNVLDAVVLRAFAFPNQPRLVRVHETSRDFDGVDLSNVAPANLIDWQAQAEGVFGDLVGLEWWDASLRGRESAERVQGHRVGASFFEALGVVPAEGRGFLAEEARPGQERKVVIGHALWQRAFGGEPVVGRSVIIDAEPFVVVGVAPPSFQFPDGTEVWAPLVLPDAPAASRDKHYLSVMGRLAEGRTREDARAALALIAARLAREHPKTNTARGVAIPAFGAGFGDPILPQVLVIWQAAALLVLAARVLRESMPAEIARFVPGWQQLGADWRSLLFSVLIAVVAAGVFSAIPAWRASRLDLNATLREGGRAVTTGGRRQLGRDVLVVGQLAAALALLVAAGGAVRSAARLLDGPQGYEPRGVLAFDIAVSEARYSDPEQQRTFVRAVEAGLVELPGSRASQSATRCRDGPATRRGRLRSRGRRSPRAASRRRWRRASRPPPCSRR